VSVVISWAARGVLTAGIVLMPNFWSAFLLSFLTTFIGGIAMSSGASLNLEQTPKSRGIIMPIAGIFGSIGASVGVSVGGFALSISGFQLLGVTFGIFGVASALNCSFPSQRSL
jgi:MFS family permease